MNVVGNSANQGVPGVLGTNSAGGNAVEGSSDAGYGVYGHSVTNSGVVGSASKFHAIFGISHDVNSGGVFGTNDAGGSGVVGANNSGGAGVVGDAKNGGAGVRGTSDKFHGVWGSSEDTVNAGVFGSNYAGGVGVVGDGKSGSRGVAGFSDTWQGVYGHSQSQAGVVGESDQFHAVFAVAHDVNSAGVYATNDGNGYGIIAKGRVAGHFDGDIEVTGDVRLLNADCAEDFDVAPPEGVDPGTVMVLGEEGALYPSHGAYDKRVAGIVSGAGDYKPALVLDRQSSGSNRQPIALMGKVFCKVDAQYGPVEIGDLLTTSPTPGYAMRAADPVKAFGSVIGKALRPLEGGQGLIPVLVALQ